MDSDAGLVYGNYTTKNKDCFISNVAIAEHMMLDFSTDVASAKNKWTFLLFSKLKPKPETYSIAKALIKGRNIVSVNAPA